MATVYSLICFGGRDGKTVTFTDTGDVVNLTDHGLRNATGVVLTTTGTLPTGVTSGTTYYSKEGADSGKLTLWTTSGLTTQVTFTGTGSGTHTIKSAYRNALTTAEKLRYGTAGSERIYNGMAAWRSDRTTSGVSVYDHEIVECGQGFVDVITTAVAIDWGAAATTITSTVNGVRQSDAFHNGVIGATSLTSYGYCAYGSSAGCITITAGNVTVDGVFLVVANSGYDCIKSTRFGTTIKNCVLRGNKPAGASSQTGIRLDTPSTTAKIYNNVILEIGGGGLYTMANQGAGTLIYNNLAHNCNVGFYAEGLANRGFYYNNICVGNDTNWYTAPASIEGAGYNGGESGNTPWYTGTDTGVKTFDSTDFLNYTNHDFHPVSSSAPQVETGATVPNGIGADIVGGVRPSYINVTTDKWDIGPFEYDWGNGLPPIIVTVSNLVSGSTVRIFTTATQTVRASTTSSGTSYSPSGVGVEVVDYTIFKDGYIPIRVTGVTLSDGLTIDGTQTIDRAFVASSGLTYGTTATVNTSTLVFGVTTATTGQNWYSFWCEQYRSNSALYNKVFPLAANGPNSFTLRSGYEFDAAPSLAYISRDGIRYTDTGGTLTAAWSAVLSVGVPSGLQVRYEQSDGGTATNAVNTGNIDQLIKVYGDSSHGSIDYRGFLVCKVQEQGYDQSEVDVIAQYGNLEDQLYVIGLTPIANGVASGNPSISGVTITDHGASPVTWNSKVFSITITDSGTVSGTDILRWIRYYQDSGSTLEGTNAFNWHDLVQTNGSDFKGVRGAVYGDTGASIKGVRVLRGTDAHPNFTLHTADDGTTVATTPPAAAVATILANSRVRLYNVTTSAEIDNSFQTGTTYSYTISSGVSVGDTLRLDVCKLGYEAARSTGLWTSTGLTLLVSQSTDPTYAAWGIDGSTVSEFTLDVTGTVEIDADDADGVTTKTRLGAWYNYILTTENGIRYLYGAITFLSTAAIRINVSVLDLKIENISATMGLAFSDGDVRLFRSDGTNLYASTSLPGSIYSDYTGVPDVVETGVSGLTGGESAQLMGLTNAPSAATVATAVLSASATTPIQSDIRKVNNVSVTGTGATGNEWGPA